MTRNLIRFTAFIFLLFFLSQCKNENTAQATHVKIPPEWSKNVSIYEVNIRQYTPEGTFSAFKEHLPKLKELGVGILWLMPINPIGELNRKGKLGSYYSVKDYTEINPEYGTKEDFRDLVNEIHKLGMHVIVDWVANHTAWDHEWTKTNPEFYNTDSLGEFTPPVDDWSDVIDLNYDNLEMRHKMMDALKYWVKDYDIDGYRCDVANMVPVDFWNEVRTQLDEIKPVFMLAEAEETNLHEKAFDMTYAWDLHHDFNRVAQSKMNADDLFTKFEEKRKEYGNSAFRMNFTSNHDENSWNGTVFERLGDAAEVMAVLSYTLDGMPLIYSGQEAGLDKRLAFFETDPIEWKDYKFFNLYKSLNKLKTENEALWNGDFGAGALRIKTDSDSTVLAFSRSKNSDQVVFISNLSNEPVEFIFTDTFPSGEFLNYFTNEEIELPNESIQKMTPWSYIVLVKK